MNKGGGRARIVWLEPMVRLTILLKPINKNAAATRPHTIRYRIESKGRKLFRGDLDNPILHLNDVAFMRDLDKRRIN